MRNLTWPVAIAVALVLAVAGCSDGAGSSRAEDPAGSGEHGPMPTEPVTAEGPVATRFPATVMDTGRPELCLGAVAESYPPQCGGPPLQSWDWADHEGDYDQQGSVRWGVFTVTGSWDGTTFVVASARPPGDEVPPTPVIPPAPDEPVPAADLARIAEEVRRLGGAQGSYAAEAYVLVDVLYDDGSLQDWADEEYGDGVVVVSPALVDA